MNSIVYNMFFIQTNYVHALSIVTHFASIMNSEMQLFFLLKKDTKLFLQKKHALILVFLSS